MCNRRALGALIAVVVTTVTAGLASAQVVAVSTAQAQQPSLELVAARDHIEAAFLGPRAVYADATRIYLAGYVPAAPSPTGALFVLARNAAAGFPLLQTIAFPAPLAAVVGDGQHLYVGGYDGVLRIFDTTTPLTPAATPSLTLSPYMLGDMAVAGGRVYVGVGQGHVAANGMRVLRAPTSASDYVQEIVGATLTLGRTYGGAVAPFTVQVFDRASGAVVGTLPFGRDVFGNPSPPRLFADDAVFALTDGGGCCSSGFTSFDASTLHADPHVGRLWVNTVHRAGDLLVAGRESGHVELFARGQTGAEPVASVDLRAVTGHTGPEDIEIRSLWTDSVDDLVFAGSSFGNDASRGPQLPSFFVLRIARPVAGPVGDPPGGGGGASPIVSSSQPGGAAQPPVDGTPPRARLTAPRRLRFARTIKVRVGCLDEPCRAVALAGVLVPRGARAKPLRLRTRRATRSLPAGAVALVALRFSRPALAVVRRALRAGRRLTATVELRAGDAAGNTAIRRARVGLTR